METATKTDIKPETAAAAPPPPEAPVVQLRPTPPKLHMGKRRERDGAYKTHVFDVPAGTDPDTVMHPLYLVHYGEDLTPGDMLIIRCEDGLWEREARVDFVSNAEVKLSARRTDKDGVVRYTA